MNTSNTNSTESLPGLKGSVLLAEDSEMNQQLIGTYLKKMGAEVTIAENGEVAVSMAKQKQFDLIYMDMQMPIMSGQEAVQKIRELEIEVPIVMLTASTTSEDMDLCKKAGSDDFVTKPVDRKLLYNVTARYLPVAS